MSGPEIWPFHARAFLGDTHELTAAETGAYIRLLIFYWHNNGLPDDEVQIRRISGLTDMAWKRSRPKLYVLFRGGHWRHKRADKDLAFAADLSAAQRAKAQARWQKFPVDKVKSGHSSRGMRQRQQFQTLKNAATHAGAMPIERKDRVPSITADPDLWTSGRRADSGSALPTQSETSKRQRAQQAWEAEVRKDLGYHYSTAIVHLARDPDLVERATQAEMEDEGAGAIMVLEALTGKISITEDDLE